MPSPHTLRLAQVSTMTSSTARFADPASYAAGDTRRKKLSPPHRRASEEESLGDYRPRHGPASLPVGCITGWVGIITHGRQRGAPCGRSSRASPLCASCALPPRAPSGLISCCAPATACSCRGGASQVRGLPRAWLLRHGGGREDDAAGYSRGVRPDNSPPPLPAASSFRTPPHHPSVPISLPPPLVPASSAPARGSAISFLPLSCRFRSGHRR